MAFLLTYVNSFHQIFVFVTANDCGFDKIVTRGVFAWPTISLKFFIFVIAVAQGHHNLEVNTK